MGNRRRSNSERPGKSSRASRHKKLRRRPGSVYTFSKQHFEIIDEVHRLFPDHEPVVDFSDIEPGTESIELVSRRLLDAFARSPEQRVFLVFCKINSARVLDYIIDRIDEEAWPLEQNDVLADVYAKLYHHFRGHAGQGWPAREDGPFAEPLTSGRTTYRMLVEASDLVMRDRVREFQSMAVPMPGVPVAETSPPSSAVEVAAGLVENHGWKLTEEELKGWVSFALLRMDREERRVLHLRDFRRMSLQQVADVLGCSAFEAGQRVKAAHEKVQIQIVQLIQAFSTGDEQTPPGTDQSGSRDSQTETEEEDETDV